MDGKSMCGWLLAIVAGASAVLAQENNKGSVGPKDLEAIKAQLKAQQERIDRLSQQVNRLNDAIRQQRPAATPPPPPLPPPGPAPAAPAASAAPSAGAAAAPATVGVERALPVEPANTRTHTVARGETLTQIAKQFGVTVEDIEHLNRIGDAKKLQAGQTIKIPPPANSAGPAPSPSPAP